MAIIHARLSWEGHGVASFAAGWLSACPRQSSAPGANARELAASPRQAECGHRYRDRAQPSNGYRAPRHLRVATFGLLGAFAIS